MDTFTAISSAIDGTANLIFDYKDEGELSYTERVCSPHFIFITEDGEQVLKAKFVRGYTKSADKFRNYKLDVIKNIRILVNEVFEVDNDFVPKKIKHKIVKSVF